MNKLLKVIEVTDEDLVYSMGDNNNDPHVMLRNPDPKKYHRSEYVDPFPCYSHDKKLVTSVLSHSFESFKIGLALNFYILNYEGKGRWNGYCDVDIDYSGEPDANGRRPFTFRLLANGKRTPLHPAMTRFIVSHEYGHAIEHWINLKMGGKDEDLRNQFRLEYTKLRGEKFTTDYNSRKWHSSVGEVFADDFRILIAGMELEHWPHPGYKRPEKVKGLKAWWTDKQKKFGK